ncbi:MAG: oxygen-independent coproporphyrinogen III oxidase, partial [bacterium]|nr:oxygen-independent coproporphyrinogen III oxidase [bacterium]
MESIDIELIEKYDKPIPRYTSYPSANLFSTSFNQEEFIKRIKNNSSSEIALYFHIPFCDTLCYFCACNMFITKDRNLISNYLEVLKKEVNMFIDYLSHSKVSQIHFGGGTPTYLTPSEIYDITNFINSKFKINKEGEFSFEADPRGLTYEHLKSFYDAGYNRVSMGVQDFDLKVQKAVNRVHPFDEVAKCVDMIRSIGFKSLNLDFIYGLPFQSVSSFEKTLDLIIKLKPDRIALFNFAYLPELRKYQRVIKAEWLPTPMEKLSIFKLAVETLTSNGYVYIGMDHFALPHDELFISRKNGKLQRNFQGYSTFAGLDLYAFGTSAISCLSDMYAQNTKYLNTYIEKVSNSMSPTERGYILSDEDKLRKYIIMEIMCNLVVKKLDIYHKFGVIFDKKFEAEIEKLKDMEKDGIVEIKEDGVYVTNLGCFFLRN